MLSVTFTKSQHISQRVQMQANSKEIIDEDEILSRIASNIHDPAACTEMINLLGQQYRGYNTMTNLMLDLMDSSPLFAEGEASAVVLDYAQKHFMHNFDVATFERNVAAEQQTDPNIPDIEEAITNLVENSAWREGLIQLARNFAGVSIMTEIGTIVKNYYLRSQETAQGAKPSDTGLTILDSEQSLAAFVSELQSRLMIFLASLSPKDYQQSSLQSWRGMREWRDLLSWICSSHVAFTTSYNILTALMAKVTPTLVAVLKLICSHAAAHIFFLSPASHTSLHAMQCSMAKIPVSMVTPISSLLTPTTLMTTTYQHLDQKLHKLYTHSQTNPSDESTKSPLHPESWTWESPDATNSENGIDPYPVSALHRHYLPSISCMLPHLYQKPVVSKDELSNYGSNPGQEREHPACLQLRQELEKTIPIAALVDPTTFTSITVPTTIAIARVLTAKALGPTTPQQKDTITQAVQLLTLIQTCKSLPDASPSSSSSWLYDIYISARKLTTNLFAIAGNMEKKGSYLLQTTPTALATALVSNIHIPVVADLVLTWIEAIFQDRKHAHYNAASFADHHEVLLTVLLHIARLYPMHIAHIHQILRVYVLNVDKTDAKAASIRERAMNVMCALALFPDAPAAEPFQKTTTVVNSDHTGDTAKSNIPLIPFEVSVLGHPLVLTLMWFFDNHVQLSVNLILKSMLWLLPSLSETNNVTIPYDVKLCLWTMIFKSENVLAAFKSSDASVTDIKTVLAAAAQALSSLSFPDDDSNSKSLSAWKSTLTDVISSCTISSGALASSAAVVIPVVEPPSATSTTVTATVTPTATTDVSAVSLDDLFDDTDDENDKVEMSDATTQATTTTQAASASAPVGVPTAPTSTTTTPAIVTSPPAPAESTESARPSKRRRILDDEDD